MNIALFIYLQSNCIRTLVKEERRKENKRRRVKMPTGNQTVLDLFEKREEIER